MTVSMRPAALILSACMLCAGGAHAQGMSASQAREEFKKAQELYGANRCKDALPRFEKLAKATDSPNAQLYVARCLRKLERLPEAYEAFSAVIRVADAKAAEDERYADTRSAAAAERAALESKVARVVIALADPPDGLELKLGDMVVDRERVGEPIAISPGEVAVEASAPGKPAFRKTLEAAGGTLSTVTVVFDAPRDSGAAASASPGRGDSTPADGGTTSVATTASGPPVLAYVALGVGVAGLATFGIAGTMANQRFDDLDKECGGGPCPASKQSDIDGGKQLDTIANIGLVVGGVGIVGGTALLLFGGSTEKKPPAEAFVTPRTGGGSVVVTGRF